jgi:hypothetical protein
MAFTPCGFPHSDTPGSMPAYGSPRHFVVRHVLLRLLAPRHPPCALYSLTFALGVGLAAPLHLSSRPADALDRCAKVAAIPTPNAYSLMLQSIVGCLLLISLSSFQGTIAPLPANRRFALRKHLLRAEDHLSMVSVPDSIVVPTKPQPAFAVML